VPECEPIFIGGFYKSGTSLLRAMLGQHPHIAAGLETYWFDIDWSDLSGENSKERLRRIAAYYSREMSELESMAAQSPTVGVFLTKLLDDHARREGKPRWAEKTPGNIIHAQRMFDLWPNAKLIHIVRDPRDIFASRRQAKKWDDPDYFAELWCSFFGPTETAKQTPPWNKDQFLEIRYEDLVTAPEQTMRAVVALIDEPWNPAVAEFEGRSEDYDIVLKVTGKANTTLDRLRRPIELGRVGLWPHVVPASELEHIRARVTAAGLGDVYERVIAETPAMQGAAE
jgi:hypothetical protein